MAPRRGRWPSKGQMSFQDFEAAAEDTPVVVPRDQPEVAPEDATLSSYSVPKVDPLPVEQRVWASGFFGKKKRQKDCGCKGLARILPCGDCTDGHHCGHDGCEWGKPSG